MIRIAVCDDDPTMRADIFSMGSELFGDDMGTVIKVSEFSNPLDMLHHIEENGPFDLILCDVYMPGLLGTEAIEELRANGDRSHVVFLTTSRDHAVDAFAVHADGYLVKPVTVQRFKSTITPIIDVICRERKECLVIKSHDMVNRVDYADILYVKTEGHYQVIHKRDGSTVDMRATNSEFFKLLQDDSRFYRNGASFILNLDAVRAVDNYDALIVNGEKVPVPVRLRKDLQNAFFERTMGAL